MKVYELDNCEFKQFNILTYELSPTWIPMNSAKTYNPKEKIYNKRKFVHIPISLIFLIINVGILVAIPFFLHYYIGMSW